MLRKVSRGKSFSGLLSSVQSSVIRNVSTWTPLAIAFNTQPNKNGLDFFKGYTGLFGIKTLSTPEGLYLMKEKATTNIDELLKEVMDPNRTRNAVQIFDDLSDGLCQVADLAEFIRMMHPSSKFTYAAEEACIAVNGLVEKLNTNRQLYEILKRVAEKGDKSEMSQTEIHVANLFLFDFEQCGIHLNEEDRKQVVYYNDSILQCGHRFMANTALPSVVPEDSVPSRFRHFFESDGTANIIVSGYFEYAVDVVRETAYKLYLMRNEHNEALLNELLVQRQKLARICGFSAYAEKAIKGSTAGEPKFVEKFLNDLNVKLAPYMENDLKLMRKIKETESSQPLAMWDVAYLINKGKKDYMKTNITDFCPYFSIGTCMEGLNNLLSNLFDISLVNTKLESGESWGTDIYKLSVIHEKEGLMGYIYCDFFERPQKPHQDCHFTIRGGRLLPDGSYQNPIVVVVLNLPTPNWSQPCLLTPSMVENLFHEMGHAIHSMLARTRYQHVTGTRCATDFAEVPSILMEYFANDRRVLKTFAKHYKTEEPIPDEMLDTLQSSKSLFQAVQLQTQVFYSAVDFEYHANSLAAGNTSEVLKQIQSEYHRLPYVENTAWQLRFSHLVGYGAKYYSYLLSKAIAATIWQMYFEKDPFDKSAGEQYKRECLAHGGGKPPQLLVKDYLGIDVSPNNFTSYLIQDIQKIYNV